MSSPSLPSFPCLLLPLLLCAPSLAGDVRIEAQGTVAFNGFGSGPLAGVQAGDPVTMTFEAELPIFESSPGQFGGYGIDHASFLLDVGGVLVGLKAGSAPGWNVANDFPVADGLFLFQTPTDIPGVWFEFEAHDSTGTAFDSLDLLQEGGVYPAGAFDSVDWNLLGGDLGVSFQSLTVHAPNATGTVYCDPAVANSTGAPGTILALESDVVADNDLTLRVGDLPLNSFGYFLVSATQGTISQPPGSIGVLCLAGTIGRYASKLKNSASTGSFSMNVDLSALPFTPAVAVQPGETWNFQAWYRDNAMGTSNFTSAVSVTFL